MGRGRSDRLRNALIGTRGAKGTHPLAQEEQRVAQGETKKNGNGIPEGRAEETTI